MEEEDAAEEAEEVGGEQREVDCSGAGHLHHYRHEAVQCEHTQDIDCKQHGCRTVRDNISVKDASKQHECHDVLKSSNLTRQNVNLPNLKSHCIAATA